MQHLTHSEYLAQNQEYKETLKEQERRRRNHQSYRTSNPSKYMLTRIRNSARDRGLDFNLELEDLVVPEVCPILGLPFDYDSPHYTPSVDRLDNNKGYIKGNIVIMTTLANRMKFQADFKVWRLFAEGTIKFLNEKGL